MTTAGLGAWKCGWWLGNNVIEMVPIQRRHLLRIRRSVQRRQLWGQMLGQMTLRQLKGLRPIDLSP